MIDLYENIHDGSHRKDRNIKLVVDLIFLSTPHTLNFKIYAYIISTRNEEFVILEEITKCVIRCKTKD